MFDDVDIDAIGTEGAMAAIAGQQDDDAYVARLIQQCDREFGEQNAGARGYWICRALYQQLVGSWTAVDEHRLTWIMYASSRPEMIEGPNGWAHERRLSVRAREDLARKAPLP